MSERALEFVETWVSEKIEDMEQLPADGDETTAKQLAAECLQAALNEGIPSSEIQEAFDDLAAFISGEIEEAREREEGPEDDDALLVDDDDARIVDEQIDEEDKDAKGS